jgi:hypothetical protein
MSDKCNRTASEEIGAKKSDKTGRRMFNLVTTEIMKGIKHKRGYTIDKELNIQAYPQHKFHLQRLPLQRCGHDGAHAC